MTNVVSINHQNIAITLSLIVIGVLAGTREHLPTITINIPNNILPYVVWPVVVFFLLVVAYLVFLLIGTCGCMGMR